MEDDGWEWDETLYAGSAAYYSRGRLPYPAELAAVLREELGLDGTGRLLDVGCGPGSIALLLAPLFDQVVAVDADGEMVAEGRRAATRRGVRNVSWIRMRAEDLGADLGRFRAATLAQSFHWMDRARVASTLFAMLEPGGSWVHVHATTHQGAGKRGDAPEPRPPREEIASLIRAYLGPVRRAGRGTLPTGTATGEAELIAAAGFAGPRRLEVEGGRVLERSQDDVVASVFSLSSAAPHLFRERLGDFEAELRTLLERASPSGRFLERTREIEVVVWTR